MRESLGWSQSVETSFRDFFDKFFCHFWEQRLTAQTVNKLSPVDIKQHNTDTTRDRNVAFRMHYGLFTLHQDPRNSISHNTRNNFLLLKSFRNLLKVLSTAYESPHIIQNVAESTFSNSLKVFLIKYSCKIIYS